MSRQATSSTLDQRGSYLIYRTALRIRLMWQRIIEGSGYAFSPEQLVLLMRLGEEEGINQQELAKRGFFDRPSATRMIDKLEKSGLIRREPDLDDRRAYRLYLTPNGKRLRVKLDRIATGMHRFYRGFTQKEKEELIRLLTKLQENLSD